MFCKYCGSEVEANATNCPHCGADLEATKPVEHRPSDPSRYSDLAMVGKVFMIIATVLSGFAIIPLAWMIPLTVVTFNRINRGEPMGIALKIIDLLFVSLIAGILFLVMDDGSYR